MLLSTDNAHYFLFLYREILCKFQEQSSTLECAGFSKPFFVYIFYSPINKYVENYLRHTNEWAPLEHNVFTIIDDD